MRRSRRSFQLSRSLISASVLCGVALGDAPPHRGLGPGDLLDLAHLRLPEHRQEHDPPPARCVVADALALAAQVEAQLAELPPELPRVRLVEVDSLLLQQVDVEGHVTELLVRQAQEPLPDLRLKLYDTPAHSNFAITQYARFAPSENSMRRSANAVSVRFASATICSWGRWGPPHRKEIAAPRPGAARAGGRGLRRPARFAASPAR